MTGHPQDADEQADAAELARRATQFPCHDITRERVGDGIRYIAISRDLGTRPYAVITASLDEICAVLSAAQQAAGLRQVDPAADPGESG